MRNEAEKYFAWAGGLFGLFAVFTVMVARFDVRPIGPEGSLVGFAGINQWIFQTVGYHQLWYTVTEALGTVPLLVAFAFAAAGAVQMIGRKSIWKVDPSLLLLGVFYGMVVGCYLIFEEVAVNYRPVILGEGPEASYPSSHTLLTLCVMMTAMIPLRALFPGREKLCRGVGILSVLLSAVMVLGRLLSGVHWLTDVVGGVLLSASLIALYIGAVRYVQARCDRE